MISPGRLSPLGVLPSLGGVVCGLLPSFEIWSQMSPLPPSWRVLRPSLLYCLAYMREEDLHIRISRSKLIENFFQHWSFFYCKLIWDFINIIKILIANLFNSLLGIRCDRIIFSSIRRSCHMSSCSIRFHIEKWEGMRCFLTWRNREHMVLGNN